jgi:hypothetical protein
MAYDVPRESGAMLSLLGALAGGVAGVPAWVFVMLPTNRRLLDLHARGRADGAHALLERWNALHPVRTGLSVAALFSMLSPLGR